MEIESYIRAGYPAIIFTTPEEDRALEECEKIAKKLNMEFEIWSSTQGIRTTRREERGNSLADPDKVLLHGLENLRSRGRIFCLLDFHPYVKSANIWRRAKDVFKKAKSLGVTYVFISAKFEVPSELEREVITTSVPLPTRSEVKNLLTKMSTEQRIRMPEKSDDVIDSALGLTLSEAENAFASSLAKYGKFDVKMINQVKQQVICNGGLLEYKLSDETMDTIGGLKNFTSWAMQRLSAYSPAAQEYGLPYPRGVLLVGVPGCGKSLTAKALANMWQKPLLRLDIGKLFGSLVGDTEANTRRALETAEAMSPAILWIDEVEKGLSGLQSSGKNDSGVTSRMFGTVLTWLQEKRAPVFVIATANNISQLPPEFLRKGRFDEIFFVDLPDEEERKAIYQIQLTKHKRNAKNFDINLLASSTQNYTGAEIEETVISAMFNAWNSNNREPTTEDILDVIHQITPMAEGMMKDQIEAMRLWCKESNIRMANGITKTEKNDIGRRIIWHKEN